MSPLLRRQRRILAGLLGREPGLPAVALIRPQPPLDAPQRRGGRQEILLALGLRQAARGAGLGGVDLATRRRVAKVSYSKRLFDLGHLRMDESSLAERSKIICDHLLPGLAVGGSHRLVLLRKIGRAGIVGTAKEHQRMGAIDLRSEVAGLKRLSPLACSERLGWLARKKPIPAQDDELFRSCLASLTIIR